MTLPFSDHIVWTTSNGAPFFLCRIADITTDGITYQIESLE